MAARFSERSAARYTLSVPAPPYPGIVCAGLLVALLMTACQSMAPPVAAPKGSPGFDSLRVVTLNAGSGRSVENVQGDNAGFGSAQAETADRWYGNGLAWPAVVRDVQAFLYAVDADIVALQEVFYSAQCGDIPAKARQGFICEDWQPGDTTVAERLLGEAYQLACHPGKPDKCLGVHRRLGYIDGCADAFCPAGLEGLDDAGCGSGNRVAAATVQLAMGGSLRVVHLHGTSGLTRADAGCRLGQVEAAFADGAAAPEFGLVLGDFNTDPGRVAWLDPAARALRRFTRPPGNYRFMTAVGLFAAPTFLSFLNIDHVLAAGMRGDCRAAGRTPGLPAVSDIVSLDHTAIVCDLRTLQ
ncbi:MAG: endonuclease/exonuclease/phosphatase family protein [Chromatocurvus sp.]